MATNGPPECFGKLWEAQASECAGGYDPGYTSMNGSHIRPKCDFFDSCKVRTQLAKSNQQPQTTIPPSALNRQQTAAQQPAYLPPPPSPQQPWVPVPPQPIVPGRQQAAASQQAQQPVQAPMPWQMQWQQPQAPQQWNAQMQQLFMLMQMMQQQQQNPFLPPPIYPGNFPVHGNIDPIKLQAVNYGMPSYLSVSEPRSDGFWAPFGREILRGMGKALGHSIAHFFDHVTLKR